MMATRATPPPTLAPTISPTLGPGVGAGVVVGITPAVEGMVVARMAVVVVFVVGAVVVVAGEEEEGGGGGGGGSEGVGQMPVAVHTWLEVPFRLQKRHGVCPSGHLQAAHVLLSGDVPRPVHGAAMYSAGEALHGWHSWHRSACG